VFNVLKRIRRINVAVFLMFAAVLTACGGGGVATTPIVQPVVTTAVTAPAVNGVVPAFTLVGLPDGVTATATSSSTLPAGIMTTALDRRASQAANSVLIAVATVTFSADVSTKVLTKTMLTPASALPATYAYFSDWADPSIPAPASIHLSTVAGTYGADGVTFINTDPNGAYGPLTTFLKGRGYLIAFYATPQTASPTPSPSQSPVPTPTPTRSPTPAATAAGPITLTPSSVALLGIGSGNAKTSIAAETSYAGTFTVNAAACTGIANVTPASGAGPSLSLTVTGLMNGTCSATITDAFGQSAPLAISVTTSGIVGN
jgi:hypothetical protein